MEPSGAGLRERPPGATIVAAATGAPIPAEQYPLTPIGGGPRSGFVEVIHPNGPVNFAHQIYQLEGAAPHDAYQMVISIWPSNPSCSGTPTYAIPSAVVETNGVGNGHGDVTFPPDVVEALGLRNITVGGKITAWRAGTLALTTGCIVVHHD
jgi:hypothetical protein